ncbi:MAG: hypothetical protein ACPG4T_19950, partial [Nannocystaceae bacterium]
DGHVDSLAGESCDPGVPSSYENACEGTSRPLGIGGCDPDTCQIIKSAAQCATCGDGVVDGDEQCDSDNLQGQACLAGGTLRCVNCMIDKTGCNTCGNGNHDPGEECDYRMPNIEELAAEISCLGLTSPFIGSPYGGGGTTRCNTECKWDRNTCSYCGNNIINDSQELELGGRVDSKESCDGDAEVSMTELHAFCKNECKTEAEVECIHKCSDACELELQTEADGLEQPACCIKSGEACPGPDDPPCCWTVENPGEPIPSACEKVNDTLSICL